MHIKLVYLTPHGDLIDFLLKSNRIVNPDV